MSQTRSLAHSLLVGLAGGLAGLAVMGWAMKLSQRWLPPPKDEEDAQTQTRRGLQRRESISLIGKHYRDNEPATDALGRLLYERATGHEPSAQTQERLSNAAHRAYGLGVASLYAALRPKRVPGWQSGLAYGLGLWALGDELAVPLLGLSKNPLRHPLQSHASALVGHLAYGATVGVTLDLLERRL